jgi:hypothetical protein
MKISEKISLTWDFTNFDEGSGVRQRVDWETRPWQLPGSAECIRDASRGMENITWCPAWFSIRQGGWFPCDGG